MSLIVEDGTARADAEAYASVAEADSYHSKRGNDLWATMTTAEKEEALRRSADYMVANWRFSWLGMRVDMHQALDWPRWDVPVTDGGPYGGWFILNTVVPTEVKNANAELAFSAAQGDLDENLDQDLKAVKVGPIAIDFNNHGNRSTIYSKPLSMIACFLQGQGNSKSMVFRT